MAVIASSVIDTSSVFTCATNPRFLSSVTLETLSLESRKGPVAHSYMKARLGEYQEMRAAKITQIGVDATSSDDQILLEPADALTL